MPTSKRKSALAALIGSLVAGTAFGGGWTLFDEQESTTVVVLNSCNAQGVCETPLNFNGDIRAAGTPGAGVPIADLAVANDAGPIRLYIGTAEDGRGFTSSFDLYDSGFAFRTTGLRFVDLDFDTDLEMIQTTRGSGNYVYRFRYSGPPFYCAGTPCINAHLNDVHLGTTDTDNTQGLAVGDLNLDCRVDVFVANATATTGDQSNKVYLNTTVIPGLPATPPACPAAPIAHGNPLAFGAAIVLPSTGVGGADSDSREVELVDVDADGDLDAIVANADLNDNWLYVNQTRPVTVPPAATLFAAPIPLTPANAADDAEISWGLAVGDLDNDGDRDIVVANDGARSRYYFNAGTGATRFATGGTFTAVDASKAVTLGDVNRDGFLDAVVANDPGPSRVQLLAGATGTVADYPIVNPTGLPGSPPFNLGSARALDLTKLDNDGWLDLVIGNSNNQYNLRFLNNSLCQNTPGVALACDPFRNVAPTVTGAATPPVTGNEDTPLAITVAAVTATDGDNLTADLRLSIESGTNYTVTIPTGPTPTITPAANYSGPLTVNVRVTDLTTQSAPFALPVTLTAVPDAPTFTSTAPTTGAQATAYSYAITTADPDTGEARTITAPTKPTWLTLTDAGNGTATLTGTPGGADAGAQNVTLEVRDAANLVASQSFTITVADANDPPTFTSTGVTSATTGTAYSYAVATSDPDAGDTRTITATTLPAWLTLTNGANGAATLAGTPAATNVGSHNVSLRVADAAGANATQTFTINVVAAAAAPTGGGGGGGGGGTGLIEVLALLAGLGAALRRRRLV